MKNNKQCVMDSISNMRILYREISNFLKTLDALMDKENYLVISSKNIVITDNSEALQEPESWLPSCFYRNYRCGAKILLTTNIVLNELDETAKIAEPLFFATRYVYNKNVQSSTMEGNWCGTSWQNYFNTIPTNKVFNVIYDKSRIYSVKNKRLLKQEGWDDHEFKLVKDLRFIVAPLLDLKSEALIKERVLEKILG